MILEIWEKYKQYILIGAGILVIGGLLLWGVNNKTATSQTNSAMITSGLDESTEDGQTSPQSSSTVVSSSSAVATVQAASQSSGNQEIYVDVKGAVKSPGIFKVKSSMRVDDAINLAGGMLKTADRKHINLAQKLSDQQVIYVPIRGEIKGAVTGTVEANVTPSDQNASESASSATQMDTSATTTNDSSEEKGTTVNLNTATKEQLQTLTSIGDKKADLILQYRQTHGKFKRIEELKEVQGIGDKTFDALKAQLSV
ncbi:helix-hairpin-helix domain-containing protein [Pediococcus siamensis]|uniref:helix-hairpin-helix domain-containing protein n=1 Tax=Pediococcus siamensis TaxID=381829 RepID=UPI0039A3147F